MKITVRAIRWNDTVKYEGTYEAKNRGQAYDMLKKDHPDVTNIGEIVKIECEEKEVIDMKTLQELEAEIRRAYRVLNEVEAYWQNDTDIHAWKEEGLINNTEFIILRSYNANLRESA